MARLSGTRPRRWRCRVCRPLRHRGPRAPIARHARRTRCSPMVAPTGVRQGLSHGPANVAVSVSYQTWPSRKSLARSHLMLLPFRLGRQCVVAGLLAASRLLPRPSRQAPAPAPRPDSPKAVPEAQRGRADRGRDGKICRRHPGAPRSVRGHLWRRHRHLLATPEFRGMVEELHSIWWGLQPGESTRLAGYIVANGHPYSEIFVKDYAYLDGAPDPITPKPASPPTSRCRPSPATGGRCGCRPEKAASAACCRISIS